MILIRTAWMMLRKMEEKLSSSLKIAWSCWVVTLRSCTTGTTMWSTCSTSKSWTCTTGTTWISPQRPSKLHSRVSWPSRMRSYRPLNRYTLEIRRSPPSTMTWLQPKLPHMTRQRRLSRRGWTRTHCTWWIGCRGKSGLWWASDGWSRGVGLTETGPACI